MNDLQILQKTELMGRELTVYGTAQEPLFLAKEVAEWIEHPNPSEMIKMVDDDEKLTSTILRAGQNREMLMLTENGIYEVLMQSRKPIAKEFKKGVKKILHEIRTVGGYIASTSDDTPELIMARALKVADETMRRHEEEIERQREQLRLQTEQLNTAAPKVKYVDDVLQSVNTYTTTQIAKELGMDAHSLNIRLKNMDIMFYQSGMWMMRAKYHGNGYTKTRTQAFTRNDGTIGTTAYTVWTEKGRMFIHHVIKGSESA